MSNYRHNNLLSKFRLLWQFRALEIKLHTRLPLLIVTNVVYFICVRFFNISKTRHYFTAILISVKYHKQALWKVNRNHISKTWNINKMSAPHGAAWQIIILATAFELFIRFSLMASETRALYTLTRQMGATVPLINPDYKGNQTDWFPHDET